MTHNAQPCTHQFRVFELPAPTGLSPACDVSMLPGCNSSESRRMDAHLLCTFDSQRICSDPLQAVATKQGRSARGGPAFHPHAHKIHVCGNRTGGATTYAHLKRQSKGTYNVHPPPTHSTSSPAFRTRHGSRPQTAVRCRQQKVYRRTAACQTI